MIFNDLPRMRDFMGWFDPGDDLAFRDPKESPLAQYKQAAVPRLSDSSKCVGYYPYQIGTDPALPIPETKEPMLGDPNTPVSVDVAKVTLSLCLQVAPAVPASVLSRPERLFHQNW